jgi:hypothetical protein
MRSATKEKQDNKETFEWAIGKPNETRIQQREV